MPPDVSAGAGTLKMRAVGEQLGTFCWYTLSDGSLWHYFLPCTLSLTALVGMFSFGLARRLGNRRPGRLIDRLSSLSELVEKFGKVCMNTLWVSLTT
jgi:hypothetical protein